MSSNEKDKTTERKTRERKTREEKRRVERKEKRRHEKEKKIDRTEKIYTPISTIVNQAIHFSPHQLFFFFNSCIQIQLTYLAKISMIEFSLISFKCAKVESNSWYELISISENKNRSLNGWGWGLSWGWGWGWGWGWVQLVAQYFYDAGCRENIPRITTPAIIITHCCTKQTEALFTLYNNENLLRVKW